uniref:Variant surface glycoprotein 1125.4195 n=1 Tax=Trypanosoma brucei TaxID=5691 RepID=A0A1J0RAH6_9TRYP|nr:variant surface glycoprotein 1125.4195 [Trypanosoma brucei]
MWKMEITLIFVCLSSLTVSMADSGATAAHNAVTEHCTLNAYYTAIESQLKSWANSAVTAVRELQQQQQGIQLAAVKHAGSTKGVSYTVLSAIARARAQKAAQYAAQAVPVFTDALQILNRKHGETLALAAAVAEADSTAVKHTQKALTDSKILTQGGSGSSNRGCEAETTPKLKTAGNCGDKAEEMQTAAAIGQNIKGLTQLKMIRTDAMKFPTLTAMIEARGNVNSGNSWQTGTGNTHCHDNASPQNAATAQHGVALHKLKLTHTTTPTLETLATLAEKTAEASGVPTAASPTPWLTEDKALAQAMQQAVKHHETPQQVLASETLEELANTPEARATYNFIKTKGGKPPSTESTAKKVANLVFGTATGTVDKAFLQLLSTDAVSIPTTGNDIKTNIKAIAVQEGFEQAMAYYYVQNMQKLTKAVEGVKKEEKEKSDATEDKTGDKKDGEKKEECTGTVETDCDKTKCTWNKEKNECKVKESAYISSVTKVPLLLAVLLL